MVKKGYKQTAIGVVPVDWSISDFGSKVKISRGGSPRPIQDYLTQVQDGINWIKIGDVREGDKYITSTEERIIPAGVSRSRMVHAGDFILSNSMSFGRPYILNIDGCIHDGWLTIQEYDKTFSKNFLYYLLSSDSVCQQYIGMAAGSSVKNLNKEKVSGLIVAYPDIKEQERIANALSNMDSLIANLEKQISKKKAIKQGTMQELLTGKRRLPGFSGDWQTISLKKALSVGHGMSQHDVECPTGRYPILATGGVIGRANRYLWNAPSVLIGRKGTISKPQYMDKPFWSIDTLFYTKINEGYCPKFLYYVFCRIDWLSYNEASGVPSLSAKTIESIEVQVPDYGEQCAIAGVLTDIDTEIEALEQKLGKYRQVKQGMMQQLLTGKIRLTNDIEDSVQTGQLTSEKTVSSKPTHNHQFDDAVSIAAIVDAFYSDKYPLGRVKVQKLLYLLHRHQAVSVSDFKKKAAGPYADTVRYRGGEPIAKKNKYIVSESGKQGTRYSKGENMAQALDYVERWGIQSDFQWLKENFLHTSRDDLELFATVDMAICDLNEAGIPISVTSIKNLIASNKDWKVKLSKTYFSDWDIARAIRKCAELFN